MGIKSLNNLLKKKSPEAFYSLPINRLSGKRVAIDSENVMYSLLSIARKIVNGSTKLSDLLIKDLDPILVRKEWLNQILKFTCRWLSQNVTPVFVFDGVHPVEKAATKAKRKEDKFKKLESIKEYRRILTTGGPDDNIEIKLRSAITSYLVISNEDYTALRSLLVEIGISCIQAVSENERLCSTLCAEGIVAAVFSDDTDNLPHRCPLLCTKFNKTTEFNVYRQKIDHLDCVQLDKVLTNLDISHAAFVDVCIIAGCDYNPSINRCAAPKAYDLINRYGSIENLAQYRDVSKINYVRSRELFATLSSSDMIIKEQSTSLNANKRTLARLNTALSKYGLEEYASKIRRYYDSLSDPTNGLILGSVCADYIPSAIISEFDNHNASHTLNNSSNISEGNVSWQQYVHPRSKLGVSRNPETNPNVQTNNSTVFEKLMERSNKVDLDGGGLDKPVIIDISTLSLSNCKTKTHSTKPRISLNIIR